MAKLPTIADLKPWEPRLPSGGGGPCSRRQVGEPNRRVLGAVERDGVEHSFHATKGVRRRKLSNGAPLFMPARPVAVPVRHALTRPRADYLNGPGKRARRLAAAAEDRS